MGRTRPTSPQTVPRLAAMTATRPQLVCVSPSLSGVKSPTRSSVTVSSNLRHARRTSSALSVACSSLRQKPGEQLHCCSHALHSWDHGCEVKPRDQRLVTSAPRSDPSTLLMTRLVYWLKPSRRAQRITLGQLRVLPHTP